MNVNAKIKSDRNESCHLHSGVVSFHVVQNQAVWAQESNSDTYWLCNLGQVVACLFVPRFFVCKIGMIVALPFCGAGRIN